MPPKENGKIPEFTLAQAVALLVAGFCVGWLAGMSISPFAQTLLTSLTTITIAVTAGLAGVQLKGTDAQSATSRTIVLNAVPLALAVVGLTCGSGIGIYARSNEWLAGDPEILIRKWKGAGVDDAELRKRILERWFPTSAPIERSKSIEGFLFAAASLAECTSWKTATDEDLRGQLGAAADPQIRAFAKEIGDPSALRAATSYLLCSKK
jgi:hypothetical protein